MNAEQAVRAALAEALAGHAELSARVNAIGTRGGRATAPYVTIGDMLAADWSTKTARGRELRCTVTIRDMGETPARLEALAALAEEAIEAMARDLPGWRVASLAFVRGRIGRDGPGGWIGLLDYRVRAMAV